MAGRFGQHPRHPDVQRHQFGLAAEPQDEQDEGEVRGRGTGFEAVSGTEAGAAGRGGEHGETGQDEEEAQLAHGRVPDTGRGDGCPGGMVGQQQHRRPQRHDLPRQQERHGVGGRGHELHAHQEDRHRRPGGTAGGGSTGRAHAEQAHDQAHGRDDGHEEPAEPVGGQGEGIHRQYGVEGQAAAGTEQRGDAGRQPGGGEGGAEQPHRVAAACRAHQQCGGHGQDGEKQLQAEARFNEARFNEADFDGGHRPVSCRRAATIAAGSGGLPGTRMSISTKSLNGPARP